MKKIIYILILALAAYSCESDDSQIGYDEIDLKPFIIDNYTRDAKQLYMNEIFNNNNHINFEDPIIDTKEVNKILKLIQAVYDSNSPQRDTIFNLYEIHGYYCYSFNSLGLKVKTELPEIKNLSDGIIPTGNDNLDIILSKYNFESVKTSYSYPGFPWLTIYTTNEYNMIPLEKEFSELSSILLAEFNKGCIGDGNNISLIRSPSSATITFSIGSGDCPSGCIYHKYWEFNVQNGKAEFKKSYQN